MGNIFSRRTSLTQILFTLDTKISSTEKKLTNISLLKQKILNYYYIMLFIITPFLFAFFHFENYSYTDYAIVFSLMVVFKFLISFAFQLFIRKYESKLLKLIEQQKLNIEKLKLQEKYKETKEIIDKYEKPVKLTGVNKPINKDLIDTLADVVLGNEEESFALICSKCFAHNGKIHPSQLDLDKFSCFRCQQTTMLKKNQEEK